MAQIGDRDIQGENISRAVKGFGLKEIKRTLINGRYDRTS